MMVKYGKIGDGYYIYLWNWNSSNAKTKSRINLEELPVEEDFEFKVFSRVSHH